MSQKLTQLFGKQYPEVPNHIVEYLTEYLTCEYLREICEESQVFDLIYPQIEIYYEDIKEYLISNFSAELFNVVQSEAGDQFEPQLVKLSSALTIDATRVSASANDALMNVAIPDRTKVDQKALAKIAAQQIKKAEDLEAKKKSQKAKEVDEVILATVSQANTKSAIESFASLWLDDFDMTFGPVKLLGSASVKFDRGHRYGIVGLNGSGKSTMLRLIASREFAYNPDFVLAHVEQELASSDTTALDSVLEADRERNELIKLVAENPDNLADLFEKLEAIDADGAPTRASSVLVGLGFTHAEQSQPVSSFSGGWRMRLALAQALFCRPDILLLDEPTNMLDMKAILWLENYLVNHLQEKTILIVVSHDRNFLNNICTNIVHLTSKRLIKYRGDYDIFEKEKADRMINMTKEYETQKTFREHIQVFIDKFRYSANRGAQVQSKIKMLNKLPKLYPVEAEPPITFNFPDPDQAAGFAVQLDEASFHYASSPEKLLFDQVCCGVDFEDRICIVGENGAGKTTILKMMLDHEKITGGIRHFNRRCKLGYFAQHHIDQLEDLGVTPLGWMMRKFPNHDPNVLRSQLAGFGVTNEIATSRTLKMLSGGQKSRVAFAALAYVRPNLLILDEPTNHLDIESVEALGDALQKFKGGVLLVSHDERLIRKVCKKMWLCKNKTVKVLEGGVDAYKTILSKEFSDSGIRV